ncbi:MAG TPA: NHLP leader peptide family RiPP precursor [Gaiellaceae bacterium]|nr:NHLP leader peptide family RiPP precursor [Gaiellaceae bacterium]
MAGRAPTEREALESRLVARALAEPAFRERLLTSPREAVAEELGVEPPEGLEIVVVEESPNRLAIVLPVDLSGLGADAVWAMTGRRPGAYGL